METHSNKESLYKFE
uniref:Uncharacterized protein n=1 Tax=Lepeophtheirus salmonis TaxID=72036 RepID=A0A0K2TKR8_LEPSM